MWDEPLALKKAKQDVREGRLWKARDRLTGLLATFPADQRVLNLLGEVHFQMADLPQAGRYWYLTDRKGPEVEAALEALVERYGSKRNLARAIPIRAPLGLYPPVVRERLSGELFPLLHPQAWAEPPAKLPRGGYVRDRQGSLKPPFGRTKFGEFSATLGGLTAAVVLIGGWGFGAIWVSKESNGFVWVPILIFGGLAAIGAWLDGRIRRRRFKAMQKRAQTVSAGKEGK